MLSKSNNHFFMSSATHQAVGANFLRFLIAQRALYFSTAAAGGFTTKSGRVSPYFINFGQLYHGEALACLAKFYGDWILQALAAGKLAPFNTIFGAAYKGIPLAVALTLYLNTHKTTLSKRGIHTLSYAFDRKEAKLYGDGGMTVGAPISAESRLLLVDDVLTAGLSLSQLVKLLRTLSPAAKIVAALVGVDREESAHDALQQAAAQTEQSTPSTSLSAKAALKLIHPFPSYALSSIRQVLTLKQQTAPHQQAFALTAAERNAIEIYLNQYAVTAA